MRSVSGIDRSPACASCCVEHLVERLARADRAGLADVEARVGRRDLGGRGRDRVDVLRRDLRVALHVPLDEHRVAVGRDLIRAARGVRRAEVLDRRERLHRIATTSSTVARKAGSVAVSCLALDEDDLGLRIRLEAGVAQDVVGAVRLADVRVVLIDVLRPDRDARRRRRRSRRRASRRPRSSSGLRSSDPCGPRRCWTSSKVTWPHPLRFSCLVVVNCLIRDSQPRLRTAMRRAGVFGCG